MDNDFIHLLFTIVTCLQDRRFIRGNKFTTN